MTETPKPQTAKEAYELHQAEIESLMEWIKMELERHEQDVADEPGNWGMANELGHVKTGLKEILAFLSNGDVAEIDQALEELGM